MKAASRYCGLVIMLALVLVGSAHAQDPVDVGAWISLFDGGSLYGWTHLGNPAFRVEDGSITCDGGTGALIATTSQFKDFELEAEVRVAPGTSAAVAVRNGGAGAALNSGGAQFPLNGPEADGAAEWQDLHIVAKADRVSMTLNGSEAEEQDIVNEVGHISFLYNPGLDGRLEIRNIRLRPVGMESLFNGKDLTGWNIIPDHQSEFTVANGELHIKNGNGQIETDGVYKNFLLQLDVFVAGEKLNSGVFLRGPKGVFWKGYESQIRNEWEGADRTKPVDYGTGGIYGRQPTREVVSNDEEWFTKTIVMNGKHLAVWVHGKQVSDFTETLPVSEASDGKRGYVTGPGTIHLQGHDPTTDLRFRNINIQQYGD